MNKKVTWIHSKPPSPSLGQPGKQEVVVMLNLKEGPGKREGVEKHRQERGERPQKKGRQDVFGDH